MFDDSDIKIAGNKPSESIDDSDSLNVDENPTSDEVNKCHTLGRAIAEQFLKEVTVPFMDENDDPQMSLQRKLLLSFTVTVGLDKFCRDDTVSGIAQKSFLDTVKKLSPALFVACNDTGAYSFYYLAFRRGNDVERRMGQTFAMLCSHDGDPIYQELGETLYCWFMSVVKEQVENLGLN